MGEQLTARHDKRLRVQVTGKPTLRYNINCCLTMFISVAQSLIWFFYVYTNICHILGVSLSPLVQP